MSVDVQGPRIDLSGADHPCPSWCTLSPHPWSPDGVSHFADRDHKGPVFGGYAEVHGMEASSMPGVIDNLHVSLGRWDLDVMSGTEARAVAQGLLQAAQWLEDVAR